MKTSTIQTQTFKYIERDITKGEALLVVEKARKSNLTESALIAVQVLEAILEDRGAQS